VRFLVSAHAATEELLVLKDMVEGLLGADGLKAVTIAWARSAKPQPEAAAFKVAETDAPNVNGARDLGFDVGAGNAGAADVSALRRDVEAGRVKVLYVIDSGPEGSIGDLTWVMAARAQGTLPTLIVQGVLITPLSAAADIVLPGAAFVEKDGLYTNDQGRVQASSRAITPPGEAREDAQILVGVARSLGLTLPYQNAAEIRRAIAAVGGPYAQAESIAFSRPTTAKNWLQASNPSERWKWDFMYQDLPPVKGFSVQMGQEPPQATAYIPLKKVE
jgi:predicted molibdopterin-dependent oxidoreductase YjgC